MSSLMAEFAGPDALVAAVRSFRASGVTRLNAYTPYSVQELDELLCVPRSWIPQFTLASGLVGAAFGYGLQLYLNGIDYPLDIGGFSPLSSLAFVPITFESTILVAVLGATFGLFAATKLPQLWHPVFEIPEFTSATSQGFWLAIETEDAQATRAKLRELGATHIADALPGVT